MNSEEYPSQEHKDIRLKKPTFIDPLTGLYNQYYLFEFPPEELKKAKVGNYSIAVLMVDLDGFKEINDTYGHLTGDEIIKQLAAILKKSVRATDMVIRYAGDEFAILLLAADIKWAEVLSQKLVDNVDKYAFQSRDGKPIHLTMSIGFSIFPQDGETMEVLIDLADKALYLSKKKGKNRFSYVKEVNLEEASNVEALDSFPCPEFIDRKDELALLKRIFETIVVKDNLLQVVFIYGESGVGKSRLLNEFKNNIQGSAAIITASASLTHSQDPYYLFAQGISSYIEMAGIDSQFIKNILAKIPPSELVQLSEFVPSIKGFFTKPADLEIDQKKARFLLFKAFLDFLIELSKELPVLIYFDDIQWADQGSMELLHHFCTRQKDERIFIISSFNEYNDTLKEITQELKLKTNYTNIELKGLPVEHTVAMVSAIFPGLAAKNEFHEQIYSVSKGNPAFVEEILKSLLENAFIFYQDNRWNMKVDVAARDMPLSMDEVIKKRLKNLDEETKELIVQAAVVGDSFSAEVLKKIGNKNEGFILEVLSRAKKMRLIAEVGNQGKFHFVNKNVQNVLYNTDLDEKERNELHSKIGHALVEENKDNLSKTAGEAAFHLGKGGSLEASCEHDKIVLDKISQMFVPSEAMEYLQSLTKEIEQEKEAPPAPLSDKMSKEALKFVGLLQRAVKNFHLYPPGAMRIASVQECLSSLNIIWQESACLAIGEAERCLIINGKRLIPRGIDQSNVEYFLNLMAETSLKSISFITGISQEGLDKFIQVLSKPPEYVVDNGGWGQIIEKEGVECIKIDEVRFVQLQPSAAKFDENRKIEKAMIAEFLLGKLGGGGIQKEEFISNMHKDPKKLAQAIMETSEKMSQDNTAVDKSKMVINTIDKINSQILAKDGGTNEQMQDLANVILELSPEIRNKVIRSQYADKEANPGIMQDNFLETIPEDIIIDVILEEYEESQRNLLLLREFMGKLLLDSTKKGNVISGLELELIKRNVPRQEIDFVSGNSGFESLPAETQVNNLIKLPEKHHKVFLEKSRVLLRELDSKQHVHELDILLFNLVSKTEQLPPDARAELMGVITEFIREQGDKGSLKTENKLDGLLKKLNIESNPKKFDAILEIFRTVLNDFSRDMQGSRNILLAIDNLQAKGYILFLGQFLNIVFCRYSWERDHDARIFKIIDDFLREILTADFLEVIIYIVTSNYTQEKLDLKDIFPIASDKLIEVIINIETQKFLVGVDAFREYIIKKEIVNLLKDLGEPALSILGKRLAQLKENMPVPLIILVGNLGKTEWFDLLVPSASHNDPEIRYAVATALSQLGGEKSLDLLSSMFQEERDKKNKTALKKHIDQLRKGG